MPIPQFRAINRAPLDHHSGGRVPLLRPDNTTPMAALFKRFALIFLPVVIGFSVVLIWSIQFDIQRRTERIEGRESSRVEIAKGLVARDLTEVDSDLRVMANMPTLRWYLDSGSPVLRKELEKIFLVLAQETRRYDQVRYLDANGREVVRINYNGSKPVIVPHEQLQNKSARYYFKDTIKLNQGEVFVSPLDLNVEGSRVEYPHKPMIRFGTPVFDSAGRKKGVILLNYFGKDLLQHFRQTMQGDDPRSGMLLNRDGYWLSSTRPEDEWGFMLDKSEHVFGRHFKAWDNISATEQGTLLTDQGLFVYDTVYPLLPGYRPAADTTLANAASTQGLAARQYYWKIVSFVPAAALSGSAYYNQTIGRLSLATVYLLMALAAWIIALVTLSRQQARGEVAKIKARYDNLVQRIPVGVYLFHFQNDDLMRLEYVSPVFCQILDFNADAVLGDINIAFAGVHPDDVDSLKRSIREAAASLQPHRWEGRFIVRGETRWIRVAADPTPQHGGSSLWSGVISDISENKKLEDELMHQARIDVLTGLNNRRHFFNLAQHELARAKRYDEPLSTLMLDVDHFKGFNDSYGHHVGDMVLQKMSAVLAATVRGIDILGRVGGEEFAILLPRTNGAHALELAERLRLAVADATIQPGQGEAAHFTVSIGVARLAPSDNSVDELLKRADKALYTAKNSGRNRVCSEGMD